MKGWRRMSDDSMSEQKLGLVPRLRFPEFRAAGEWERKKLSQVCEMNPSAKALPEEFVYIDLESVEEGRLLQRRTIPLKGAPSRAQRLLKRGDLIFQTVRPYQKNNYFFEPDDDLYYVASTGYAQLRACGSNKFLFQYLHHDGFVSRVLEKCTGSNYPAINSSDLSAILVEIPRLPEQQKIADCLSSLDALIAAQAAKLDALKTHKKGLMQQLFPREGETVPRLRFPEFRVAGEWEEITLGKIAKFISGGTPSKDVADYWKGSIPWISASSMHDIKIEKSDFSITDAAVKAGTRIAKKGTLLLLVRGSMLHKRIPMGISAIDVAFNQDVKALELKGNITAEYLIYFLSARESELLGQVTSTGIGAGKLDTHNLREFPVVIPVAKEQHKITDCLYSLDSLIAAQADKLDALKTHKQGLMQQLFPSPEADIG